MWLRKERGTGQEAWLFLTRETDGPQNRSQRQGSNPQAHSAIQAEILNYHKDDHPYWVHLSIDPLHDANGEPTGFIAVERDITPEVLERRRTEEELGSVYRALIDTLKHQETVVE